MAVKSVADNNESAAALCERLHALVTHFPQSEIARRTGVEPSSVHRYLAGRRVPADFCAALIEHFGVNPSWLMTGRGPRFLSDLTDDAAAMGGAILRLVDEMNTIARARLDALGAGDLWKMFRELNASFERIYAARREIEHRTYPVLKALLAQLNDAALAEDIARAAPMTKAVQRLAVFVNDHALTGTIERTLARYHFASFDFGEAMRHSRRAVESSVERGFTASDIFSFITSYVEMTLHMGSPKRRRMLEALTSLANGNIRSSAAYCEAGIYLGVVLTGLGDVSRGTRLFLRHAAGGGADNRAEAIANYAEAQLLTGALSVEQAMARDPGNLSFAQIIVSFARWRENLHDVRLALKHYVRPGGVRPAAVGAVHLIHIREALESRDPAIADRFAAAQDQAPRKGVDVMQIRYTFNVCMTQLLRLTGRHKRAREHFNVVEEIMLGLGDNTDSRLPFLITHHHNALALFGERASTPEEWRIVWRARRFFQSWIARGYHSFKPIAAEFGIA